MSDIAKSEQSRRYEEELVSKLLSEQYVEVLKPLYPPSGNLIADAMNGEGILECFRSFTNKDKSVLYSVVTFGWRMCGHKGILHGGASAAILDQFFGIMIRILNIKGFTGQLSIQYKKIILCPSTVIIKGEFVKTENRKHFFTGTITDMVGDVCIEADSIYIQADIEKVLQRALEKVGNEN